MRTRQELYIETGVVYTCELEQCPSCHERLRIAYTSKFKTVQTMEERLRIAQRAKHCINPDCALNAGAWGSVKWRQIAPVSCSYGYDVIAQIGWQRQTLQRPFAGIHEDLQPQMGICESQVRALYHYRYLPLLACHERQQLEHLKRVAEQAGLILTLDGLAPEGGEPQLWLVRELLSGATLRCGWMSQQDQAAFAAFLRPIADLGLPVSAVLSDKQSGLLPAIAEVFPQAKHALCQIHYLRNVAAPVAEADEAMKVRLRQGVRETLGQWLRQEKGEEQGVLTITGMLPSPVEAQPMAQSHSLVKEASARRDAILRDLCCRIRYLLTLKGNPPLRLAGLEMYARLKEVEQCLQRLIAHQATSQLLALQQGLHTSLNSVQATYDLVREAGDWLEQISDLLDPGGKPVRSGHQVRQELFALLDQIQSTRTLDPFLRSSFDSIQKTTLNYAPGLFHCYDLPGLPRTNNDRESEFRDLYRRLLRTTGQRGLTRRIIQREGAWELLPRPVTLQTTIQALSQIAHEDYQIEHQRMLQHRKRFRLHTRSAKQSQAQLFRLEQDWIALPPDTS